MTSYLLLLWVSRLCDHQSGTTRWQNALAYISLILQLLVLLLALIKSCACMGCIRTYAEYVGSRKAQDPVVNRKHLRRITWLNSPYSKSVKTRVGQEFLKLIHKNFPVGSRLYEVFNRNKIKVSYSCLPNMGTIIKQYNAHICGTEWKDGNQPRRCNCRKPEQCPLNGQCLTSRIVYKATVETNRTCAPKVYMWPSMHKPTIHRKM